MTIILFAISVFAILLYSVMTKPIINHKFNKKMAALNDASMRSADKAQLRACLQDAYETDVKAYYAAIAKMIVSAMGILLCLIVYQFLPY